MNLDEEPYHLLVPCGHTVCLMLSPSRVSRHLTCLSSPWFSPASTLCPRPPVPCALSASLLPGQSCLPTLVPKLPRPTASLLPGQSRLPALVPLPRQIASLLLVSLACRCLWPTYSTFTESAPVVHTSANLPRPRYTLYTFHGSH